MNTDQTPPTAPADGGRSEQKPRPDIKRLLSNFTSKHYAMAADEWKEGASESSVRRHYDEAGAAEDALVAEMDRLLAEVAELRAALEEAQAELIFWQEHNRDHPNPMIGPGQSILKTLKAVRSALATRRKT